MAKRGDIRSFTSLIDRILTGQVDANHIVRLISHIAGERMNLVAEAARAVGIVVHPSIEDRVLGAYDNPPRHVTSPKVYAIKVYRDLTNSTLRRAKDAVDEILRRKGRE